MQEHAQVRTTLPFARTECFAANFIGVEQLINNDDNESIKNVYELTLQIKVWADNFKAMNFLFKFYLLFFCFRMNR